MTLPMEAMFDSGEDQERIDYTPSGAALAVGEVIEVGDDGLAAVCTTPGGIADGTLGSVATAGNFKFKKATSVVTFALGANVFWDASANLAIASAGEAADFVVGTCIKAAAAGDDHVLASLNRISANLAIVDTT